MLLVIVRFRFKQSCKEQRFGFDDPASFLPSADIMCFSDSMLPKAQAHHWLHAALWPWVRGRPRKCGVRKSWRWGSVHFCCRAASKFRLLLSVSACAWSSTFQPLWSDPDLITWYSVFILHCFIPAGLPVVWSVSWALMPSLDLLCSSRLGTVGLHPCQCPTCLHPWLACSQSGSGSQRSPALAASCSYGRDPSESTEQIPTLVLRVELLKSMSTARNTSTFKSIPDLLHRISAINRVRWAFESTALLRLRMEKQLREKHLIFVAVWKPDSSFQLSELLKLLCRAGSKQIRCMLLYLGTIKLIQV